MFVTFIQVSIGGMPHGLLAEIGFSKKMVEKSPTLFAKRAWNYFREWLAINGVTEIHVRSKIGAGTRKYYLAFKLNAPAERIAA